MQPKDNEQLKQLKTAILRNIDIRFLESDVIKLSEVLDLEKKQLVLRQDATNLLEEAIQVAVARGHKSLTDGVTEFIEQKMGLKTLKNRMQR